MVVGMDRATYAALPCGPTATLYDSVIMTTSSPEKSMVVGMDRATYAALPCGPTATLYDSVIMTTYSLRFGYL